MPILHFGSSSRAGLIKRENEIGWIDALVLDGHKATGEGVVELMFFLFLRFFVYWSSLSRFGTLLRRWLLE